MYTNEGKTKQHSAFVLTVLLVQRGCLQKKILGWIRFKAKFDLYWYLCGLKSDTHYKPNFLSKIVTEYDVTHPIKHRSCRQDRCLLNIMTLSFLAIQI